MLNRLIYYGVIIPSSLMPMWFLHGFSRLFIFIIYNIFGYRKIVVFQNLRNSFPQKSEEEITQIASKFYRHFGQISAEGVKGFTIGRRNLMERYKFTNPELVNDLFEQEKSVILVSGHQGNWEFLVQSLNLQFKHDGIGVGKKISSEGFGNMMDKARTRFGMTIWDHTNVREKLEETIQSNRLITCMLLADQSPGDPKKAFWMKFLNQDTPTIFGPEYFAVKYDIPILYYEVLKTKPGYYEITLIPVSYEPTKEAYGDITFKHNKLLEASILKQPETWLWSHKRWKHAHMSKDFDVRNV